METDIIDVDYIQYLATPFNALQRLVLPKGIANTIEALSCTYDESKRTAATADVIRGKGEGRIFLLHGPP